MTTTLANGGVATGLLLTALAAGCREPNQIPTYTEFTRQSDNCNGGPNGEPVGSMDTYVIELFDVDASSDYVNGRTVRDCQNCIADGACVLMHPRVCACGPSVPGDWRGLDDQLRNTSIPDLDSNDVYCLRVLAVARGAEPGAGPASPCGGGCLAEWPTTAFLADNARLCAMGTPLAAGPVMMSLDVSCPADGQQTGGGGGGGSRTIPFNECLVQPPTSPM